MKIVNNAVLYMAIVNGLTNNKYIVNTLLVRSINASQSTALKALYALYMGSRVFSPQRLVNLHQLDVKKFFN